MASAFPNRIDLGDVTLRRPQPDDAEALLAATTIDLLRLGPWMSWASPRDNTVAARAAFIDEARAKAETGRDAVYLLIGADDGILGTVGLHDRVGPGGIELGYWLASAATGRGIMTRVVGALTDLALSDEEISRVEIHTDEANVASAAIPRRLGFTLARTMDTEVTAPAETGRMQIWVRTADDEPPTPSQPPA